MANKPFPVRLDEDFIAKVAAKAKEVGLNKSETLRRAAKIGLPRVRQNRDRPSA